MKDMHFSMDRLYKVALSKRVNGQSAVAHALNISPQRVKNWESRGISEEGALLAQKVFGCNANWLLREAEAVFTYTPTTGNEPLKAMESNVEQLPAPKPDRMASEILELFARLGPDDKSELLTFVRGFVAGRRPHQDGAASVSAG